MSLKFLQRKSKKDFMKVLRQIIKSKRNRSRRNRTRKLFR